MSTFYRFAGLAVLLISFGLLVSALPSPRAEDASWVIVGDHPICELLRKFFIEIKACIYVIAECNDIETLKLKIAVFVALCNSCAAELLNIGADVKISVEAQASIVTCFAAMLTLWAKVCVDLTVKFGVSVVATLCVTVDACLHLLLKNLDICIKGVVAVILKACAAAVVGVFVQLKFKLCLALFAKLGLSI